MRDLRSRAGERDRGEEERFGAVRQELAAHDAQHDHQAYKELEEPMITKAA
jgi:hypothetical protein